MQSWKIDEFENEHLKLTLSLVSNEHYMQLDHRKDTKVIYNLTMIKYAAKLETQWYNEDFTSFAAAWNTFEIFQLVK